MGLIFLNKVKLKKLQQLLQSHVEVEDGAQIQIQVSVCKAHDFTLCHLEDSFLWAGPGHHLVQDAGSL